jgi:hypothetical protein
MGCNDRIGWFYYKAADHSQKYKEGALANAAMPDTWCSLVLNEGKYLLEREKLVKENKWMLDD